MEAFESFVAIMLEAEGLVVSEAMKFPVALPTKKAAYQEIQTHGYEVDLVPGWPQSRRQVRLCAGLQAAASALCAVVAHGV